MTMEQLFYNGDIITMENKEDKPEAVLVRNGIIAAVGTLAEVQAQAGKDCVQTDLQGNTLMPSFVDAHGHLSMTVQYMAMADLSSAESFEDIVQLLKEFKQQQNLGPGEPIFGYSYDHNFLKEQTYPTCDILDQVSVDAPIGIWHTSAHMAVVNSKAMELLGIDENTPSPEGGLIARYPGTNKPNGYLEETALAPVRELQMKVKMNLEKQLQEAQMKYISHGVTTVQDGAGNEMTVNMLRKVANEGRLLVDVVAYPSFGFGDPVAALEHNKDCVRQYVNRFKIGGYKIVLDGSPQGKTAWMTKPYENSGDYCGYPWMENEAVEGYIKKVLASNQQVLVHCNGDAAGDQYLNAYEKAYAESDNPNKANLRPVMIHCQTAREDQLDRMQKLNMIPSIFVAHVNYWGDVHLKNFGQERGSRVSPVNSALKRGLVYNFHTDTPVVQPDMFHTIWAAVNRVTRNGIVSGPEQRIDVYDALKGLTINAAYEYFEENSKGSIKVGKRADLIIVDQNPLKADKMELKNIQVLETIKDGVTLYRK